MAARKTYEPHCPAADCSGGHSNRLFRVNDGHVDLMPADMLSRRTGLSEVWGCGYCHFVWFQSSASFPGFDPTPAGFHGNFRWPEEEFHPVSATYGIRKENTTGFWRELGAKRARGRGSR
jgi:hypothetical protein